jgi:hypothetical protein
MANNFIVGAVGIGDNPLIRVIPRKRKPPSLPPCYRDCYGYGVTFGAPGIQDTPDYTNLTGPPFSAPLTMTVTTSGLTACPVEGSSTFVVPDGVYVIPWNGTTSPPIGDTNGPCAGLYTDPSGFTIYCFVENGETSLAVVTLAIFDPDGNQVFDGQSGAALGDPIINVYSEFGYPPGECGGTCTVDIG